MTAPELLEPLYDSDEIHALRTVPEDAVVVGGGAIGVEFATALTALGIPVTLVNQADLTMLERVPRNGRSRHLVRAGSQPAG